MRQGNVGKYMREYVLRRKNLAHAGDRSNIPGARSLRMYVQTYSSNSLTEAIPLCM
jgi:hypothetical protein